MTTSIPRAQFAIAFQLAYAHGHWWAVKAPRETWEVARSRPDAIRASVDAHRDGQWVGPAGPEDVDACRAIAAARNEYAGVDLRVDDDGHARHITCTNKTQWDIDPAGSVTLRRHAEGGAFLAASAKVAADGRWSVDVSAEASAEDVRRLAECLDAIGQCQAARAAWLQLDPGELTGRVRYLEEHLAKSRQDGDGAGYPPAYWERYLAAPKGALAVLMTPLGEEYQARYSAARAEYIRGGEW